MAGVGHQDAFLLPRLSARYRFSQGTLAGPGATGEKRRERSLRCAQPLDETAPFELIDYGWIGEACSTDLTFNRSEKISTWLTSSNGT